MSKIFLAIPFLSSLLLAESNYGWDIPFTPVNVGGYLDMTYDDKRDENFLFDDIALLLSANKEHFSFLGELELTHISLDGKSNGSNDVDMNLERFELSYAFNNEQRLKIGKFNSNVGYWNESPIKILEDTTTKPQGVTNYFPTSTSGVQYTQQLSPNDSLSLTFQHNNDLVHQDNIPSITRHKALAYHGASSRNDALSWRLSVGDYETTEEIKSRYLALGTEYEGDDIAFQSELFMKDKENNSSTFYSGYVQSTWHLKEKHDVVARVENYKDELNTHENIYLLGYTYRPTSNMAIKAEYIKHSKLPLNRFVYSLSVLF